MMSVNKKSIPIISILLLWIAYSVVYTIHLNDALAAFLELLPGVLGIVILLVSGFNNRDLYLQKVPISRRGALFLSAFTLVLVPILLTGDWNGWHWLPFLVYAPASGIAQELFFRAALLPLLIKISKGKKLSAVVIQAVLFTLWHIPLAFAQAPIVGAIAVVVLTFIGGIIWGWQVHHDKTVYWAMAQHIVYLMIMSLFSWG
jgi:membrane protease YdiL (CAAX protease family)